MSSVAAAARPVTGNSNLNQGHPPGFIKEAYCNAKAFKFFSDAVVGDNVLLLPPGHRYVDNQYLAGYKGDLLKDIKDHYGIAYNTESDIKILRSPTMSGFDNMKQEAIQTIARRNLIKENRASAQAHLASAQVHFANGQSKLNQGLAIVAEATRKEEFYNKKLAELGKTQEALLAQKQACNSQRKELDKQEADIKAELEASEARVKAIQTDAAAKRKALEDKRDAMKASFAAKRAVKESGAAAPGAMLVMALNGAPQKAQIAAAMLNSKTGSPPKPSAEVTAIPVAMAGKPPVPAKSFIPASGPSKVAAN
jgi:hypothetical protein